MHRAWPRHLNRHSPFSRPASAEEGIRQFLAEQDTQELLKDDRTLKHFLACISPEDAHEFALVSSPTTQVRERVAERFAVFEQLCNVALAVLEQTDGKDAVRVLAEAWPLLDDDARCGILEILHVMVNYFDDFTPRIFKLGIELAKKNGDYSLLRRCALFECQDALYNEFPEHFLFLIAANDMKIVDLLIEPEFSIIRRTWMISNRP